MASLIRSTKFKADWSLSTKQSIENTARQDRRYSAFYFFPLMEPKDGKIAQAFPNNGFYSCRDGLISNMKASINDGKYPTDKMRMGFIWYIDNMGGDSEKSQKAFAKGVIERATNVLHVCERLAGWRLTRPYQVETGYDDMLELFYLHSSRRWLKCSYLVSLYVMLVRMCKDGMFEGVKNFDDLEKRVMGKDSGVFKSDGMYITSTRDYWRAILVGYPELFQKRKMEYYWSPERVGGYTGGGEGMYTLSTNSSKWSGLHGELVKIRNNLRKKGAKK